MVNNELALSARVNDVEKQTADHAGQLKQLNQAITQGNRMTIWQFVGFTLVMAGTLFGTLAWISSSLRAELQLTREHFEKQIQLNERNMNERFTQMEKRFELMEKRFDDLRQDVLSQRKQASPR